MKKTAFVLLASMTLVGCVGPTPYQPSQGGFGYTEQQIESDRYRVNFTGNSVTPRPVVENYLLYRAAEITLASGHDWFVISHQDVDKTTGYTGFADPDFGYGAYGYPGWYGAGAVIEETPYNYYDAEATIIVGSGPKIDPQAYDARDVLKTLHPAIQLPVN
jgi:hypothetical protein